MVASFVCRCLHWRGAFLWNAVLIGSCCHGSRTFLCDNADRIRNGTLAQEDGLRDMHIEVGTGIWDERFLALDETTGAYVGLEVKLLEELSRRGRFTYSLNFHNWTSSSTWLEQLQDAIGRFDLVTYAYWFITPERMSIGAYSPYGILDAVYWAVVMEETKDAIDLEEIFSFLTPFSGAVWLSFLGLMVATGLMYRVLEVGRNSEDFPDGPQRSCKCKVWMQCMDAIFQSSGHITGASSFSPRTWAGKILVMSWTWCVVLILAAYTANLASFLVVQAKSQPSFSSLSGAVNKNKNVCVAANSADHDWFRATFPNYRNLIPVAGGPTERARRLREGTCDVATLAKFEYEFLRQSHSVNPNCYMQTIGEPLQSTAAGWMVLNDVTDSCTSLVRDVLGLWLLQMELDGTLRSIVKKSLMPVGNCVTEVNPRESTAGQLKFESMLGIFTLHAVGVGTAVLFHFSSGAPKAVSRGLSRTRSLSSFSRVSPKRDVHEDEVYRRTTQPSEAWEADDLQ
ncbi:GRID1 [Symbiodinium sp. CCMP2456]|nr:GRID1 [Symbiodinium sp. CCMP2456]